MNWVGRRRLLIAGGMLLMAALAHAQQARDKVVRIGILVGGSLAQRGHLELALLQGLREQGLVEGRGLIVERRYADGRATVTRSPDQRAATSAAGCSS